MSSNLGARSTRRYEILGAFLGWLGAVNQILVSSYLLSVYRALSTIYSNGKVGIQVYLAVILLILSASALVLGSLLMLKGKLRAGGIINLGSGMIIPIPTYLYFALLSEPTFLSWLGIQGVFLRSPAIFSGAIGMSMSRLQLRS